MITNPFQKIKSFVPDLQYIEEEPIEGSEYTYESDPDEKFLPDNLTITFKKANSSETDERFTAFLDGTYRLARMGYLAGVPVYIASIAGALLERDKSGKLHDTGLLKNLIAVIYPFESAKNYHDKYGNKKVADDIKEFLNVLRDIKSDCILYDHELKNDVTEKLAKIDSPTVYIVSDTSYRGLINKNTRVQQIDPKDVYSLGIVYRKARARARVLMSILEAAYLKKYRDKNGFDNWVLVDGTLNYTLKFFFKPTRQHEAFQNYFKKTVGFIKTIRRKFFENNPNKLLKFFSMKEEQYTISIAYKTDTEEEIISEFDPEKRDVSTKWGFVYLRFRLPNYLQSQDNILTNKGIVKLQFVIDNDDLDAIISKGRLIANMACFERYPLPSDRKRIWNEPLAIEEAEKVAKSRVHDYRALESSGVHLVL